MRKVTLVLMASVLCLSIFLAPVTATAAEGIGSGLVLKAGFGCKMQDGKLVCGKTKKSDDDDSDDDDDDDADDDDKPKKKGDDAGLTNCTIQTPGSGGGCKTGKWVCEKLKSGKKCCGCVPDPNAKSVEAQPPAKKGGSYCSQEVPESTVPLAEQTCTKNHPGGWLNCSIPKPGFVICCCNWL